MIVNFKILFLFHNRNQDGIGLIKTLKVVGLMNIELGKGFEPSGIESGLWVLLIATRDSCGR